jgi:hypothetical protein
MAHLLRGSLADVQHSGRYCRQFVTKESVMRSHANQQQHNAALAVMPTCHCPKTILFFAEVSLTCCVSSLIAVWASNTAVVGLRTLERLLQAPSQSQL